MRSRLGSLIEIGDGVLRTTLPLDLGMDHVHCYFLRGDSGAWMLVDTGYGYPGIREHWKLILTAFARPVKRIVITHFHPDHVGAAAIVADLVDAPVYQGRMDYEQCVDTWSCRMGGRLAEELLSHGMPVHGADDARAHHMNVARQVRYATDPFLLDPGEEIDGWRVWHLPGHASGHLGLSRGHVLLAGDVLLAGITPNVSLQPGSRRDPLGDYMASLQQIIQLGPQIALTGHRTVLHNPVQRAAEIIEHHRARLAATAHAVAAHARSAYEVSCTLFPSELTPVERRFALFEALAHLEYLCLRGHLRRSCDGGALKYVAQ